MKSLYPYFHPTCIAVLSTSQKTREAMAQLLPERPWGWHYRFYTDPQQALEEINAQETSVDLLKRYGVSSDGEHITLDVRRLHEEMYRPNRLQKVSTVLVDADTALQPCDWFEQLHDKAIQRVCFGELPDQQKVLLLMRQGHFDQFIYTNEKEIKTQLQHSLQSACDGYFAHITAPIRRALQQCIPDTALLDPFFADFFQEKMQELKIAEYCLYMPQLAFVLVDIYAKQFGLFVKLPKQLEADRKSPQAARLPQKLQDKMRMRETMLCYAMHDKHETPDSSEWPQLMREPRAFWGQQAYYAAMRRNVLALDEDKEVVMFDPYEQSSPKDLLQQQSQHTEASQSTIENSQETQAIDSPETDPQEPDEEEFAPT
ncbi:MAG: hypothetical protein AAF320_00510 [Myxococcota bacterium]